MEIYVCCYGNEQEIDKGIVKISYNEITQEYQKQQIISLQGKANMLVINKTHFYVSEQRNQQDILITYTKDGSKVRETISDYFYSYGTYSNGKLYLASFRDGVDSIYDCEQDQWIKHVKHVDTTDKKGRSHMIQEWNHQFISVDNALQKIYFYHDAQLNLEKILSFPDINIRLLSIHPSLPYAYLNTEITNEVIVLDMIYKKVHMKLKMTEKKDCFSGGNAINKDGTLLAVSVRGEDHIYLYDIFNGGTLFYRTRFSCGAMPRDLYIHNNLVFVSCSLDNVIEVYDLMTCERKASIPVYQPITFGIGKSKEEKVLN